MAYDPLTQLQISHSQDLIYEFEFQFESKPDVWFKTDVKTSEALACINTGLLKNMAVSRIKLFAITDPTCSVGFIYDVIKAKQGNNPWSLLPIPN